MVEIKDYKKVPVVIKAVQFTETSTLMTQALVQLGMKLEEVVYNYSADDGLPYIFIETLEGRMVCKLNDWILKGVKGELYPCKDEIFKGTYEEVG